MRSSAARSKIIKNALSWVPGLLAAFALILILPGTVLAAAPSSLLAHYAGAQEEVLTWKGTGNPADTYNLWQSTDGISWTKVNAASPIAGTSTTAAVTDYVNYFFVVTTTGVAAYPTGADATNTTNMSKAYPPDDNKHEYFTENTNLCAECHQTHTGKGPSLINQATALDLCLFCHDGSGSKYDELNGKVSVGNGSYMPTPAGPFGDLVQRDPATKSPSSPLVTATPTSNHLGIDYMVTGLPFSIFNAPGGDAAASTPEWNAQMSCVSCHQPHTPSNYRLLKSKLPTDPTQDVPVTAFAQTGTTEETVTYYGGIVTFCTGCHTDFMAGAGAGRTQQINKYGYSASGFTTFDSVNYMWQKDPATVGNRRHALGVAPSSKALHTTLPLEGNAASYNDNKVMCLTCHQAHGSTAAYTLTNTDSSDPPKPLPYNIADDSFLMRSTTGPTGQLNVDLCQNCHNIDQTTGKSN